jgi:hypothetical protein
MQNPNAIVIPATYHDAPETIDPASVAMIRDATSPDIFAREWERPAA